MQIIEMKQEAAKLQESFKEVNEPKPKKVAKKDPENVTLSEPENNKDIQIL